MVMAGKKSLDDYNKVVACAEISSVQLVETQFKILPEILSADAWESSHDIDVIDTTYKQEKEGAFACLSCVVETKIKEEVVLSFQASYIVFYKIGEECDEESVFAFLKRVAPFACYPYFRALFASMCSSANISMPPLPILKE